MERAQRLTARTENYSKEVNDIPLVITFNPAFKNVPQVIRRNYELLTICRGRGINQRVFTWSICLLQMHEKIEKKYQLCEKVGLYFSAFKCLSIISG